MKKCVLVICDLNDGEIFEVLLFNNVKDKEDGETILSHSAVEWEENALESIVNNFYSLDEEVKPMYEHLLGINCQWEYQLYCLENSGIKFDRLCKNKNDISIYYN